MGRFESAQQLFAAYQKTGNFNNLRDSLDLLAGLIESDNADSLKATNFKMVISRAICDQMQHLHVKCNIPEFSKNLKTIEELATALSASLSDKDASLYMELLKIRSEHFK